MKFNHISEYEICPLSIQHAKYGHVMCMRLAEHPGACEARAGDAATLDGVCYGCRFEIPLPHTSDLCKEKP